MKSYFFSLRHFVTTHEDFMWDASVMLKTQEEATAIVTTEGTYNLPGRGYSMRLTMKDTMIEFYKDETNESN